MNFWTRLTSRRWLEDERGKSPEEAKWSARREFGNRTLVKEVTRGVWGFASFETWLQDSRIALRSLRKAPGFALLIVFVLALGIGANTAVFSVVDAVLLKPLAYRDSDRIVTLSVIWNRHDIQDLVSMADFQDWHDQSSAFEAMAFHSGARLPVTVASATEFRNVAVVTPEFFRVFAVEAVRGRLFSAEEHKPSSGGAALISHALWHSQFGGDPRAIGQTVRFGGLSLAIAGILPAGFHFPENTDVWLPAGPLVPPSQARSAYNFQAVARLRPDIALKEAQAQLDTIASRLERQYPDSNKNKGVLVTRMRDAMVRDVRVTMYLLLGVVAILLLIACANVANLLLARATGRAREVSVRAALGASRSRIVRQLTTESLVLALTSGGLGVLLAHCGSRALVALAPGNVPRLAEVAIDGRVLVFTFAVSVLASLLFGLAPAWQVSQVNLGEALKEAGGRNVMRGGAGRLRSALVVCEVALSAILLVGAGLLIRSLSALHDVDLGYRPDKVLAVSLSSPGGGPEASARVHRELLADISRLPGVTAAGATRTQPGRVQSSGVYWIDRIPARGESLTDLPQAVWSVVSPGTFATLAIPVTRGRDFEEGDEAGGPLTAIINETLARKAFPGRDPLGHTIVCGLENLKPMRIVGVVGDTRQYGPAAPPAPEIFLPWQQHAAVASSLSFVVRTAVEPERLIQTIRQRVRERAPQVPVEFTTLEAALLEDVAAPRFRTLLLGSFAGLAVCLAMAGVYSVMTYVVRRRSPEIALRIALGAAPGRMMRKMLGEGMALGGAGLALGLAGALAGSRLLSSMLFQVKPGDGLTYAAAGLLLALVSLAATWAPARRAATVDPLVVLRQE